jgi:hypothetical protein
MARFLLSHGGITAVLFILLVSTSVAQQGPSARMVRVEEKADQVERSLKGFLTVNKRKTFKVFLDLSVPRNKVKSLQQFNANFLGANKIYKNPPGRAKKEETEWYGISSSGTGEALLVYHEATRLLVG